MGESIYSSLFPTKLGDVDAYLVTARSHTGERSFQNIVVLRKGLGLSGRDFNDRIRLALSEQADGEFGPGVDFSVSYVAASVVAGAQF